MCPGFRRIAGGVLRNLWPKFGQCSVAPTPMVKLHFRILEFDTMLRRDRRGEAASSCIGEFRES